MKLVLYIVLHCGMLLYVKGEFFEFGDKKNKTCILLNLDASFNLTYRQGNDTQNAELFDLNGAVVVESSSECGNENFNSILMVRLFPSHEKLKFTFETGKTVGQVKEIYMKVDLYMDPAKHFHNMNATAPLEMKDSADLFVGYVSRSNDSYACRATQKLYFTHDAPFAMTMNITDLQVQAYNVTDSDFGPVIECEQDLTTTPVTMTTVEPVNITSVIPETTSESSVVTITIEPVTQITVEPVNITTAIPETTSESSAVTTTAPESGSTTEPFTETTMSILPTTSGPKPAIPKYIVREGNKVCIVLQGHISFEIQYQKKDNTMSTARVVVPYNAAAVGNCTVNNLDPAQQITLTFFNSPWILDIIISRKGQNNAHEMALDKATTDGSDYSWQQVKLKYVVDDHFDDAKDQGKPVTVETDIAFGKFEADDTGSYKCKAGQNLNMDKSGTVNMVLSNMQYRAFGNTNSAVFPNTDVTECAADNHTQKGTDHKTLGIVLGCVFGGLAVIILGAGGVWYCRKRKTNPYENL